MKPTTVVLCALLGAAALFLAPPFSGGQAEAPAVQQETAVQPEILSTPPIGVECRVQFRRDALGMRVLQPSQPLINSPLVSVIGILRNADSEWIVIQDGRNELWIPREAVLCIEVFR